MSDPIPDKAQVSIDFPHKFYMGSFGRESRYDVTADEHGVDVVLTDMVMPGGMTGADLFRHVREKYPEMKVVFTSGYAEGAQLPVDGAPWLRKPYTLTDLARTLRELLG